MPADPAPGRPLAVIDIDGVVADVTHRLHHLQRRPKDWDAFFAGAAADPPLAPGVALVRQLAEGHDLVYLTGRPSRLRQVTRDWLDRHGLPPGRLVMRADGDRRPARLTKTTLLERFAAGRTIGIVVDDDPDVCAALEQAGYPVRRADWADRPETLHDAQERAGRT